MKHFICAGGGTVEQSKTVDKFFVSLLPNKRFLFLPQAVAPEYWSFDKVREWIQAHDIYDECEITVWKNIKNKTLTELENFDAIFVMGGNTFSLLDKMKNSSFIDLIPRFLDSGRPILGFSAGSILMGKSIRVAEIGPSNQADENKVGITKFDGLDLLNGYTTYTHYGEEEDAQLFSYAKTYNEQIIGIPEESAIYVQKNSARVIGEMPVVVIKENKKQIYEVGSTFSLSY
jgi:dipeptidase E